MRTITLCIPLMCVIISRLLASLLMNSMNKPWTSTRPSANSATLAGSWTTVSRAYTRNCFAKKMKPRRLFLYGNARRRRHKGIDTSLCGRRYTSAWIKLDDVLQVALQVLNRFALCIEAADHCSLYTARMHGKFSL